MNHLLPQKHKQKKELTEKQELFVNSLIRTGGSVPKAMKTAGYEATSRSWLVNSVSNEIVERTQNYLATHGMKAATNLINAQMKTEQPPRVTYA